MPTPLQKQALSPMHTGYHHNRSKKEKIYILLGFFFFRKANEIKKAKRNARKKTKNYIQQGQIEFTLKEHPGRADLPGPYYSPDDQSAREMALSVGH